MIWRPRFDRVREELRKEEAHEEQPPYEPSGIEGAIQRIITWRNKLLRAEISDNTFTAAAGARLAREILDKAREIIPAAVAEFSYDYSRQCWYMIIRVRDYNEDKREEIRRAAREIMARQKVPASFMYIECRY